MRRITLIFALLLSLMGVRQANAGTFTETFDDVTVTSRYLLSNGWVMVHNNGGYQGFGGNYDYQIKSGNYDGNAGSSLYCNYSDANEYVVIPTKLTGTFTYYAKRAESNGTINFFEATKDGDTFTIGSQLATTSTSSSWGDQKSFDLGTSGKYVAIQLLKSRIDQITASTIDEVSGPALMVTGDDNGTLNFGMVNPGDTKDLTLMNPGTEDITVSIATTGGFTTDASKTIAAGGEETLSIAAPTTIGASTGKVTITPTVDSVDPVEITLSCIIKDPTKLFEDFSGNALPEDWTSTGSWSFSNGYANAGNNSSLQLTTPIMVFDANETFAFDAAGSSTWEPDFGSNYAGMVVVQTSTDGQTFTELQTFSGIHYNEWQNFSVNIPEGTKYVRFVSKYASIDNIYGGKLDETPRPKLEVEGIANGGTLSWGYSDVPAGTTKTITLKNDGAADLYVTIAATDDYTVDPATATVEAGGTFEVTIGTPAHDGNGVLTITPSEGSGLNPYTINLTSYWKEPKPVMSLDKTSIAFGRVNEVTSETITVSNTGDAELVVTITNDNTDNFTVVPAEELTVAPGEEGTITITYNFVEGTWGTFNANVKLTPNYGSTYDAKTITVSATSKNPNAWDEDFEEGAIPANWIADGWTVSTPGSFLGGNGTQMAGASSQTATLITPRLIATEGQELTFELGGSSSSYPLTVEYSIDRESWETVASFTEDGTQTIAAPTTTSTFYLRFTGWVYIDNLAGFKLDLPAHDAFISATTIPATGTQYSEYTASVTVKEQAGKSEELTAKFFIGETQYGEDVVETVNANGTKTFTVTFTPEEAISGDAYFTVTNADIELTSEKKAVEIAAAPVLDETAASEITTGNVDALVLKYTPKNGWNTICVPFALTEDILNQIFGEGWKAYEFKGYSDEEGFKFYKSTSFYAGYPYLVYTQDAQTATDGFKIENVNIATTSANYDQFSGVTFQGTFAPMAAGSMQGKYGVVPNGNDIPTIQKGGANATLKGYRGYFEIPSGEVKNFGFTFVDDATGISQFVATPENGAIYDLNGNKVKNLVKGQVYIMNGQKILVK